MDFNMKKKIFVLFTSIIPLLFTVSKLYYTYYHLRLLMMVCIVLIGFILNVLQESSNLDAIFIVCRKIKNKISPTDPPSPIHSLMTEWTCPGWIHYVWHTYPQSNGLVLSWPGTDGSTSAACVYSCSSSVKNKTKQHVFLFKLGPPGS